MTVTYSDGSQTATLTTEHTLATISADGTYQLQVDCNNMALGDVTLLRAKLKVRSSGTTRLLYEHRLTHVQASPVVVTVPVASTNELVYTLTQTAGTGRAYPWEIVQLDA